MLSFFRNLVRRVFPAPPEPCPYEHDARAKYAPLLAARRRPRDTEFLVRALGRHRARISESAGILRLDSREYHQYMRIAHKVRAITAMLDARLARHQRSLDARLARHQRSLDAPRRRTGPVARDVELSRLLAAIERRKACVDDRAPHQRAPLDAAMHDFHAQKYLRQLDQLSQLKLLAGPTAGSAA